MCETLGEGWKRLFEQYIKCYDAISVLYENGIFDEEEKAVHEHNLMFQIIKTMKFEVEGTQHDF